MTELNAVAASSRLSCHAVERIICEIWSGYFGRDVSPYDDFFDLGGDSLAMIDVVGQARERGLPVRSSVALRNPSPARLAESLTLGAESSPVALPALYVSAPGLRAPMWTDTPPEPIVDTGAGEPLYVVHSDSHIQAERDAIAAWGGQRPVKGFPLPGARGPIPPFRTVGEIAAEFLVALRKDQPAGPYRLAGFGHGAVLAFELARRLRENGDRVALLALIKPPATEPTQGRDGLLRERLALLAKRFGLGGDESVEEIHARVRQDGWYDDGVRPRDLPRLQLSWADLTLAVRSHKLAPYGGAAVLFQDDVDSPAIEQTWRRAIEDLEIHRLDYGIESPSAVIHDARLAVTMRKALQA
jgi:thioesterase domain-containing protein